MRKRRWVLVFVVAAAGCAPPAPPADPGDGVGVTRAALGEPQNGFPSWDERVIHLWINRGRADPQADLTANCSPGAVPEQHCYTPQPPLVWSYELNRSARFHSANQTSCGTMTHPSPCTLVADIGTQYTPGPCNGDKSCACQGGTCSCQGSGCTDTWARISMFGGGGNGECVASGGPGDPLGEYYMWICESFNQDVCQYAQGPPTNGHRWNILMGSGPAVGTGCAGNYCTLDFGGPAAPAGKIVVGAHYPESGTVAFRAHWYDSAPPQQALVNVDGTCQAMTKERGVDPANATYLLDGQSLSGCHHYFFVFKDSGGALVAYPDSGSFGVGCGADWDSTRPPTGSGCDCTPACDGKECGPDGCGGSCAPGCAASQTCQAGQCACAATACGSACCNAGEVCYAGACCSTSCGGKQCGPDGCGGSCGACQGSLACSILGQCGCPAGLTPCGTTCVNTTSDVTNCGSCGHACTAPDVCAVGSCSATCPAGSENCSGSCADLTSDATHCGACERACSPGASCSAGDCVCPGGLADCPGSGCTDLATDPASCGACGHVCDGCQDGRCPGEAPDGGVHGEMVGSCGCRGAGAAGGSLAPLALLLWLGRRRRAQAGRGCSRGSVKTNELPPAA